MCPLRRAFLVLSSLFLVLCSPPAHAFVLFEDPLEEESLEIGVLVRSFAFLQAGSVLRPPYTMEDVDPTGRGMLDLRLSLEYRTSWLKVVVHDQLTSSITAPALSSVFSLGRGLEPRRVIPLEADLVDEDGFSLRNVVDWVYLAFTFGPVTITAGRQPVTFGRGKLWQATDLVSTFSLTEVDSEFKPGADAVRLDWTVATGRSLTLVAAVGEEVAQDRLQLPGFPEVHLGYKDDGVGPGGSALLLRYQHGWGAGEAGALAGYVRGDVVLALDVAHDAGSFDLYAEVAVSILTDRSMGRRGPVEEADPPAAVARAVVGGTFKPHSRVTVIPEVFYNGFGALDAEEYLLVAQSARVAVGETYNLGQIYVGATCMWEAHPLLNIVAAGILNAADPSGLVSLAGAYNLASNVDLILGMYLPLGRVPDVSQVPASGVPDPFSGAMPIPRSEFGMYPYFFFAELKAAM